MCHSCHDRQASTIIRNLTRGIIANHTNLLSTMQCIAMQQLQYEGIWIITTLPTWTKYIITHRAAHVMFCPHRAWVGKYKTLIWSADTLWENRCQKWGKGVFFNICIWDAFWLLFLHVHTVATGHGILNSSIPPACLDVEATYIFFWILFNIQVFSQKSPSQGTLQILWEWGLDFLRLRDWLVCIFRLLCKTYS